MSSEFRNEPFTDFSQDENRKAMKKAIAGVEAELGKKYPLVINGEEITREETFASINPSKKSEVIGAFQKGTPEDIERAVTTGWEAFASWSKTPANKRAQYLFDAVEKMRERKHTFSAWMVLEEGKSWVEADADTAEAIDFMNFYANEMLRLSEKQPLTKLKGEENSFTYIPLGVGAVIPPWNFPLAILCGMTTAAIVSGNCVVLKPSSDSPAVGYKFVELMREVGIPKGVLNFVTGSGSSIGDPLVTHPKIRFISFTGSKEIGLRINELAAKHSPGQIWLKRVVAEMGGKDSMVIDEGVDTEDAATAIVAAAFGYQGQKCSACSRAIVHESLYDEVIAKVKEKTEAIIEGPGKDGASYGAVINQAAYKKTLEYIEIGKKEGTLVTGGKTTNDEGYFIAPTVFKDIDPQARMSQEEIFGPVLAFIKAKNYDHALEIANNTEFGLTGAVYTNSDENWKRAQSEFHVGNLYRNRKCTGALVGVHPFGGFNMSGTDSKAGGRDYLLLFTQGKLTSEKIIK